MLEKLTASSGSASEATNASKDKVFLGSPVTDSGIVGILFRLWWIIADMRTLFGVNLKVEAAPGVEPGVTGLQSAPLTARAGRRFFFQHELAF